MYRARKKTRIAELEEEVAALKKELASSREEVKRLEDSEATLRNTISSACSTLANIDVAKADQSSVPSPPASTYTGGSVNDEADVIENDSDSIPTSTAVKVPVLSLRASTFNGDTNSTWKLPLFDDDTAFALRDEATGLTLGLPLRHDYGSMLPYDSFSSEYCTTLDTRNHSSNQPSHRLRCN